MGRYTEPYRINRHIQKSEVRVISEEKGNLGILPLFKALSIAEQEGLDLVEISPNASPPVCKIVDYNKFKYQQKKKEKENKSRGQRTIVKEIRFGPNTDAHDFDFKVRHAINFLSEGYKIKTYVHFAGRSIMFKDRGVLLLLRFAEALTEHGRVEVEPKLEGKRMNMLISPLKKK